MAKGCSQCLRIFLVIINSLFLLIGLAILGLALFLYFEPNFRSVKESSGLSMQIDVALFVAMGVGGLTVLVSAFGCCGAYHESACLLGAFFAIVFLVCCVEIGGGAFLYIQRSGSDVRSTIATTILASIRGTNATSVPQHIRYLQQRFQCCGANGTADYDAPTAAAVCKSQEEEEDGGGGGGRMFTEGCAGRLFQFIQENGIWALAVIIAVAAIELLTLIFAIVLCCSVRREGDGYMGVSTV